jgi:hypothetical protein
VRTLNTRCSRRLRRLLPQQWQRDRITEISHRMPLASSASNRCTPATVVAALVKIVSSVDAMVCTAPDAGAAHETSSDAIEAHMMKARVVRYFSGVFLSVVALVVPIDSVGAQQAPRGTVTGKVTSAEDGEPIPGVSVSLAGQTIGA